MLSSTFPILWGWRRTTTTCPTCSRRTATCRICASSPHGRRLHRALWKNLRPQRRQKPSCSRNRSWAQLRQKVRAMRNRHLQAACLSRVGIGRIANAEAGVAAVVVVADAAMDEAMAATEDRIAGWKEPQIEPPTEFQIEKQSRGLRVLRSLRLRAQIPA